MASRERERKGTIQFEGMGRKLKNNNDNNIDIIEGGATTISNQKGANENYCDKRV